jgi:TRAP-type C4-dicarboxylate transport system permease small subunit
MSKAGPVQRTAEAIELVAAAFLALMTALTFVAVFCRYVVGYVIPDGFEFSRLLLGVAIFWGIATANYRDEHIGMDMVWSLVGPRGKRVIDWFAGLVTLVSFVAFWWMFTFKVYDTRRSGETTFDLHIPLWYFYALAWVGTIAGVFLLALRLYRMATHPATQDDKGAHPLQME